VSELVLILMHCFQTELLAHIYNTLSYSFLAVYIVIQDLLVSRSIVMQ